MKKDENQIRFDQLEETWKVYREDQRTLETLVSRAVEEWGDDDVPYPDAMTILHFKGNADTLDAAKKLCTSTLPLRRSVGVTILAQLGVPTRTYPDECIEILTLVLEKENDPNVIADTLIALGHHAEKRPVAVMTRFGDHPDARVRYALAFGLLGIEEKRAVSAMLKLMTDSDPATRDFATFGIGMQIDADTPKIREILFHNLYDEDEDVRFEALAGLARRRDIRILNKLVDDLAGLGDMHCDISTLCDALADMKAYYTGNPEILKKALAACCEKPEV